MRDHSPKMLRSREQLGGVSEASMRATLLRARLSGVALWCLWGMLKDGRFHVDRLLYRSTGTFRHSIGTNQSPKTA